MALYLGYYSRGEFHILCGPISDKQRRELDRLIAKVEAIQKRIDNKQSV